MRCVPIDGVMPNPLMENTFLAQAGDLDDPVSNLNCYHSGCCTNMSASKTCTEGIGCDKICHGGSTPDYSWGDTPVYMGPIRAPSPRSNVATTVHAAVKTMIPNPLL
jgi:hypothetical protein